MSTWTKQNLFELGTVARGKSKHRPRNDSSLYGGNHPFIQTSDIKHSNFYITKHNQTYNDLGLKQSKLWPKNTLCLTIAANIAESGILKYPACFPDSVVGFIADPKKSNVLFVKYTLDHAKKNFQKTAKGTAQDNLSLNKIKTIEIDVPKDNIDEQNKIASVLSVYDYLIENNEKRIKILEEMAERLYREWFVKFKFPSFEKVRLIDSGTEYGKIPEGWKVKRLGDIGKVITGKTPSTTKQEFFGGDVLFIKTPDMHGNIFIIDSEQKLSGQGAQTQPSKSLPEKTVFISCIGTLGVVGITTRPSQTNQQINALILNESDDYVLFYNFAKDLKQKLQCLGSNGATMGNVNKGKFENIFITYPEVSVRKMFSDRVNSAFEEILNLQKANKNLSKIRDLLIPQLVTSTVE